MPRSSCSSSSGSSASGVARRNLTRQSRVRAGVVSKLSVLLFLTLGACVSQHDALLTAYEAQQRACLELPEVEAAEACVETVRAVWKPVWAKHGELETP